MTFERLRKDDALSSLTVRGQLRMSAASSVPHGLPDEQLTVGSETWKLGRLLGRGGFASVYECVASGSGVRAAVKVIDLSQQSQWAQSKLRSEGDNLRRAQRHENIIELIGEARIGHLHLFVTERFGRDLLESVLEQRGLGEAYSRQVMVQVMRALAWLHEKRICHGYARQPPAASRSHRCARAPPAPHCHVAERKARPETLN